MTREDFMQLCERAADFCDVCKSCTITITKLDGEVITMTVNDITVIPRESGHQLREVHKRGASVA